MHLNVISKNNVRVTSLPLPKVGSAPEPKCGRCSSGRWCMCEVVAMDETAQIDDVMVDVIVETGET